MRLIFSLIFAFLLPASLTFAQSEKIFKTKYSTIYYSQDQDLNDFLWRIGGMRFEFSSDTSLAQNRIDRIVERVQAILDMWPKNFNIDVYLCRGDLLPHKVAYYEHKTKSIHASIDNVSDGVFAHEVAHAVISRYFSSPPPSKAQEILTQYVDKYLWNDY